jgi:hypothetical protein
MKHNIVRTVFFFATLLLALAAVASAQDGRTCSLATLAGEWGVQGTGTLILPQIGPVPYAAVGRFTRDADGNFSGTETVNVAGKTTPYMFKGTTQVNSDCTGKLTWLTYDMSGNLVNTATIALVWVDNEREALTMVVSITLPNGASLPAVISGIGEKMFPNGDNEQ